MRAPNFLAAIHLNERKPWSCATIFLIFALATALLSFAGAFSWLPLIVYGLVCVGLILFFAENSESGLYVMAVLCFFSEWQISLSSYGWAKDIPYLSSVIAPAVDLFAVVLLIAFILERIFYPKRYPRERLAASFPGAIWYGLFLCVAAISIIFIYDHQVVVGIKYLIRMLLFPYVAFIFLPSVIIERRVVIEKIFQLWFFLGIFISIFGLLSVFFVQQGGFTGLTSYTVYGFAPLGNNHNLLAQLLVVILPVALYICSQKRKSFYYVATACMFGVALLTLSRAAWIAIVVQTLIFFSFYRSLWINWIQKYRSSIAALASLAFLVGSAYVVWISYSPVVSLSNESRKTMLDIAIFYITKSPVIGYGPGMYFPILADTSAYIQEFGDPLDSHGFIQKIFLEEGIFGLFFFIGFLLYVLHKLWHTQQSAGTDRLFYQTCLLMCVGIIMMNLFNTSYFQSIMWLPMGIALTAVKLRNPT